MRQSTKNPHRRARPTSSVTGQRLKKRRMLFLGLALLALLCIAFLPIQVRAWMLQSELKQLQGEKQALLIKQQQIQQQIGYYSSDAYVEEAARQDLDLVKPGEALVLPAAPGTKPSPRNYQTNGLIGPYGD